jgi:hypothetical protein
MYADKFPLSPRLEKGGLLCFVVLLAWLLSACQLFSNKEPATPTPAPSLEAFLMDRSILTDEPCQAPCWYGLELGSSGRDEIKNTLDKLSFINPDTIEEGPDYYYLDPTSDKYLPAEFISADCRSPQQRCVVLEIVNKILASVELTPNYYLSIDEVVNHLGPPDYIRAVLYQDNSTCMLVFSWEKKPIEMERLEKNGRRLCSSINEGGRIPPYLAIDWIAYGFTHSLVNERANGKPWPGFTEP